MNKMAKDGLSDKVISERRTGGSEEGNHVDTWENQGTVCKGSGSSQYRSWRENSRR